MPVSSDSSVPPLPQSQLHYMSMASTQPLTSLLSSQGGPMSGSPSFIRPPVDLSYPFQQTAGPSFSSYQQTAGSSFSPNTQVPLGFQQTGGYSFPPNTQVPPGF